MQRIHRVMFLVTFLACCWLAMQAAHEAGHVLGAVLTGGKVKQVVLYPLALSRTDLNSNPRPLAVAWAGPLLGILVPCALLALCRFTATLLAIMVRFFFGFCCIANGLYLGVGSFGRIGDAGDLLRLGTPSWVLGSFGLVATGWGLWTWHRLGGKLGWEAVRHDITRRHTIALCCLTLILIATECTLSDRG